MRKRYNQTGVVTIKYEDLNLGDSDNLYDGTATVDYEYLEGDPSVGVRDGFEWNITGLTIQVPVGNDIEVDEAKNPVLWLTLITALEKEYSDHIQLKIERDL